VSHSSSNRNRKREREGGRAVQCVDFDFSSVTQRRGREERSNFPSSTALGEKKKEERKRWENGKFNSHLSGFRRRDGNYILNSGRNSINWR
jgi:hypothetical protein